MSELDLDTDISEQDMIEQGALEQDDFVLESTQPDNGFETSAINGNNLFRQAVSAELKRQNVSFERFSQLLLRLLDYGVLMRGDSATEAEFYDLFVRCEPLVHDYFELLGIRLLSDRHFQFVRLVPPGARVPGMSDSDDTPYNGGLRARLSQAEIACVLMLRCEYDKGLSEGKIDDGGCVKLSLEALAIALKNTLARQLPDNITERRQLLRKLKQLKLIDIAGDSEEADSWLKIKPIITSFVSDQVLAELGIALGEVANTPAQTTDSELTAEADSAAGDNLQTEGEGEGETEDESEESLAGSSPSALFADLESDELSDEEIEQEDANKTAVAVDDALSEKPKQ